MLRFDYRSPQKSVHMGAFATHLHRYISYYRMRIAIFFLAVTVFSTCFSDVILVITALTGFDVWRVSLYNSWVRHFWAGLVTHLADSLLQPKQSKHVLQ